MKIALLAALMRMCAPAGSADWPDLSRPAREQGGGENDVAVVVGAERYAFVAHVPGAVGNADDWHLYLTRTRKVPAGRVRLLRDDEATLEELRSEAAWASREARPGGTLWFVFIGHGAPGKEGKEGMLVGIDAQQKPQSLHARSLSQSELMETLLKGGQDRVVAVLDTCFSGRTADGSPLVQGLQPLVALARPSGSWPRAAVFTAGGADQFAGPLPGKERPAFSYLLLGALRGWADSDRDGSVTAAEAMGYVRDALQALVKGRRQVPELQGSVPGPLVARGAAESGPDLGTLARETGSVRPPDPARPAEPEGRLEVVVEGVRGSKGEVGVALFNSKAGFPVRLERAFEGEWVPVADGRGSVVAVFESVPPGEYAVSAVHDENGNRAVDRNAVGFPREGVAFSNGRRVTLRAPRFDECKLAVGPGESRTITLKLDYRGR